MERISQPGEVTAILILFVFQRAGFPGSVVGRGVPGLLRVAATGALKRATKQTWQWQGWGMLQIPAVLPQRGEDSLMSRLLS